mmetsp:Transcript_18003/g.20151  ORF Transcript_18003/g.20151 Transcript_18003/m.20151 type:complete len:134 (-) Transcript_18003:329-730(-)
MNTYRYMMRSRRLILLIVARFLMLSCNTNGQQPDDYAQDGYSQDSLYADYAKQQQMKEVGKAPFGWSKILIGTGVGWVVGGKIHAQRKEKKLNIRHKEEQKALYSQYYNDVYQLQQQNAEMSEALQQLGYRVK